MFKCKWCPNSFKKGLKGNWNLKGHRDGDNSRKPCPGRARAIDAGARLPPTYLEKQEAKSLEKEMQGQKEAGGKGTLNSFLSVPKFTVALFNMIMILFLLRTSTPWIRMEDPYLQAAFLLCNPAAKLWSASWSARKAMKAFEDFHAKLIQTLQVCLVFLKVIYFYFYLD